MAEVLLVFERIRLGQYAAATMAKQIDLAQAERDADGFDIVGHVFDGVLARVLEALRLAGAALVNEDEVMRARQRQEPRQKLFIFRAGTTLKDNERRAFAEFDVVDVHAVRVDITRLHRVDGGRGLRGGKHSGAQDRKTRGEDGGDNSSSHGHHATARS